MKLRRIKAFKDFKRLDVAAFGAISLLALVFGIVVANSKPKPLQVTQISWKKPVSVANRQLRLTFNRPIESAPMGLQIEPPLPGELEGVGRTLTYTLTEPPVYGTTYQISLQLATPRQGQNAPELAPFTSQLTTRDRLFAYIGIEREEQGRIVIYNLSQQKRTILTPPDLSVTKFAVYPSGEKILFSAYERTQAQGFARQQLYTVMTGLEVDAGEAEPIGRINRILDADTYQNLDFDLSNNGKTIIVARLNRRNLDDSGLWIVPENNIPQSLGIPARAFMVAPDGQRVAVVQDKGIAILPLAAEAGAPEFFPSYGRILGFSADGLQKLMVKNNPDYTQSLMLVSEQGQLQELSLTVSPIIDCQFEPTQEQILYCLRLDLVEAENGYQQAPFLTAINLQTGEETFLLTLPNYQNVQLSISPDGTQILFDQTITATPSIRDELLTAEGEAIAAGLLWSLPLNKKPSKGQAKVLPEELFSGFKPHWLP